MKKVVVGALASLSILVAAAPASASYNITQRDAENTTLRIAEKEYADRWGVATNDSFCYPQSRFRAHTEYFPGRWHRWTCTWTGTDFEGTYVHGSFIVAGQSRGGYRYQQVYGGLSWD